MDDIDLIGYRRFFLTADLKLGETRGSHAHKLQTQLLFVIQGQFRITFENKNEKGDLLLSSECDGIEIPNLTWSTQTPTKPNSVLLVIASDIYTESDYIRDYDEFLSIINEKGNK